MSDMPTSAPREPRALRWLWITALVIVLDQLSKAWVLSAIRPGEQIPVISGFWYWTLAFNRGAAFSLLADGSGWQRWFFIVLAVVMTALLSMWILRRTQQGLHGGALGLVLGGALGNGIDRIVRGHVVDFIDFYVGNWHWPAFNIADSAIVVGVGLLLWRGLDAAPRVTSAKGSRP